MNDKEVLQKAIEIAIENGMSPKLIDKGTFYQLYFLVNGRGGKKLLRDNFSLEDCYGLMFSHDFAKAFWGTKQKDTGYEEISGISGGERVDTNAICIEAWKYHLQQMVLEENPIDYLRKFVKDE